MKGNVPESVSLRVNRESTQPNGGDGGQKKTSNTVTMDAASTITSDTLAVFRKKFHFPSDLVVRVPKKNDRARDPPPGFITMSEMMLRAGLRFPLAPELIEIFKTCDVALSQFSFRALVVIVGLVVYFRERGTTLSIKHLCGMCRFVCDGQGRVSYRGIKNGVDFLARDPTRNWSSGFFFVENNCGLPEKWGRLKRLPDPTSIGVGEILRLLNVSDFGNLQVELRHISKFVTEDRLFKVGLSIQAGRSDALPLKRSKIDREGGRDSQKISNQSLRTEEALVPKKRAKVVATRDARIGGEVPSKADFSDAVREHNGKNRFPPLHIPEDILKHICTNRQRTEELVSQVLGVAAHLNVALDEWNDEFVKIKFLRGEYERRLHAETKRAEVLGDQLAECRTELANMSTSLSLQRQEVDRAREELIEALTEARGKEKQVKELIASRKALELEKDTLQKKLSERESTISASEMAAISSRAVEDFKNSVAYRSNIEDCIQEARDQILEIEVKDLERQCLEEGFTRGFLKAVRLVHRKTGVDINGVSQSQVSEDLVQVSDDEDIESELRKVLPSDDDDDDVDVDILP